jgi:hypothetical protein
MGSAAIAIAGLTSAIVPWAVAGPASAVTPHATQVHVIANCTKAAYEPPKYIFACGDANVGMTHVKYLTWGSGSATGTGTYVYNTCNPNCASGTTKREPGTKLRLHNVVRTQKYGPLFTKATVTYPNGKHQTYTLPRKTY